MSGNRHTAVVGVAPGLADGDCASGDRFPDGSAPRLAPPTSYEGSLSYGTLSCRCTPGTVQDHPRKKTHLNTVNCIWLLAVNVLLLHEQDIFIYDV